MLIRLPAGSLNRRIRFERKVADTGFTSAGKEGWQPVATVWAQVQDVLPSRAERAADGLTIAKRPARVRIRFRTDITADMRIVQGDRVMQIIAGPVELGNRDGLEMMAENYSTSGGGA